MTATLIQISEIATRWRTWATQAATYATTLEQHGEHFDATLKRTRAHVRSAAADILRHAPTPTTAANEMIRHAIAHSIRHPPLIGYDDAALNYTRARTWQACAHELNPNLPEIQPRWT